MGRSASGVSSKEARARQSGGVSGAAPARAKQDVRARGRLPRRARAWFGRVAAGLKRGWPALAVCAVSGLALASAFPTFDLWPLGFVGLAPFLCVLRPARGGAAFGLGLWFGWVFYYAVGFWLNSVAVFNRWGYVGIPLAALYCAVYVGLFGWIGAWLWRRRPGSACLTLPALWMVLEWLRSLGQLALPWAFLSHTQSANLLYIQMADIGGAPLVSFCLVATGALLAELWGLRGGGLWRRAALWRMGALAAFVGGPFAYGAVQMSRDWTSDRPLHVAISQPNINQIAKLLSYSENVEEEFRQQLQQEIETVQLTQLLAMREAAPETQLHILPETSFTEPDFAENERLRALLGTLARRVGAPVFFGADNKETDARTGVERHYVSAWLATPEEGVSGPVYNKMRLVPFGESLPYFHVIPLLQDQILGMGVFDRGTEHTLFRAGGLEFGCGICFESIFARHMAQFVKGGADFLTVITNDAWYMSGLDNPFAEHIAGWKLDLRGPAQHDAHSTFRAIETRRWLARSANTGVSRLIDPAGRTAERLEIGNRDFIAGTLYGREGLTLYARFGDWVIALAALWLIGRLWIARRAESADRAQP